MKKLAILLTVIGFAAAAPLATAAASEDGIDLMPNARGIEMTHYSDAGSSAVKSSEEFYNLGTGGVSPQ